MSRRASAASEIPAAPAYSRSPSPYSELLRRLFEVHGTAVRLIRHQRVTPEAGSTPCSYYVRDGAIALEIDVRSRHIAGIWHAGDVLEPAHMPPFRQFSVRALRPSELWRWRHPIDRLLEHPNAMLAYRHNSSAMQRRIMVAGAMLGQLTAEERVISFLISSALRTGRRNGSRIDIGMPPTRADIGEHLALNPDTLSRIMTRLQDLDLVEVSGRHTLSIKDWAGLCSLSPLPTSLLE